VNQARVKVTLFAFGILTLLMVVGTAVAASVSSVSQKPICAGACMNIGGFCSAPNCVCERVLGDLGSCTML